MVFVTIHTPWPISKGLDRPYLHVYACLFLCFMLALAFLVLGFATLDTLSRFVVVWLCSMPMRPCLNVTIWEMPVASCIPFPFSASCDDMLTMLVCVTRWLSMHLYMLAYMSMHEPCLLVCHPYFNTVKLWTSDLNLHLSSCEHHILFVFLLVCLLAYTLAFLLCLPCLSRLSALCLFHMLCAPFSYIACLLVSCICHYMYTYGVRTYRAKARSPRHKQKGKDESMSI